jgi:hypothetical protein
MLRPKQRESLSGVVKRSLSVSPPAAGDVAACANHGKLNLKRVEVLFPTQAVSYFARHAPIWSQVEKICKIILLTFDCDCWKTGTAMAAKREFVEIDPKHHRKLKAIRRECRLAKDAVVPSMKFLVYRALETAMPQLESLFRPTDD